MPKQGQPTNCAAVSLVLTYYCLPDQGLPTTRGYHLITRRDESIDYLPFYSFSSTIITSSLLLLVNRPV